MPEETDLTSARPEIVENAVLENSAAIENAPYWLAKPGEVRLAASSNSGSGSSSRLHKPE